MKRSTITIALALLVAIGVPSANAETHINAIGGFKILDSEDWDDNDEHASWGLQTTFGPEEWPVQIAIDTLGSITREEDITISTPGQDFEFRGGEDLLQSTFEFDLGVRKIWSSGKMHPYLGGGLAIVYGRQERNATFDLGDVGDYLADLGFNPANLPGNLPLDQIPVPGVVVSQDDQGVGVWVNGGIFWRLGQHWNLGFDVRYSTAEVRLFDEDVDAGGLNAGLLLGYSW